jgi:hypothetical protein
MRKFLVEPTRKSVFDEEIFTILEAVIHVQNFSARAGGTHVECLSTGAGHMHHIAPAELELGPGTHERWVPLAILPSPHVGCKRG